MFSLLRRGPEPATLVDPSNFDTLEKLRAYIDSPAFNGKPNNADEQLIPSGKLPYGPYKNGITLECMQTSGNNLDCLIHAFLMSTCPEFRRRIRMSGASVTDACGAKQFATMFRKNMGPEIIKKSYDRLPNKGSVSQANLISQLLQERNTPGDLENEHLIIFSAYYGINTLIFAVKGRGFREIVPRMYQYGGNTETYILSNLGGHYESVRVVGTNTYTIPIIEARKIVNEVEYSAQADLIVQYNKGDPIPIEKTRDIMGNESQYFVYDIIYIKDTRRAEIYKASTNQEAILEYLEYLQKNRNISMNIRRNINISEDDIAKWGSGRVLGTQAGLEKIDDILEGVDFLATRVESDDFKAAYPVAPALPPRASLFTPAKSTPANVAARAAPATLSKSPSVAARATPATVASATPLAPPATVAKIQSVANPPLLGPNAPVADLQGQYDAAQQRVEAAQKRVEELRARIAAKKAGKGGRRTRRKRRA
jgi:hypothetical protein